MHMIRLYDSQMEIRAVEKGIFRIRVSSGDDFKQTLLSEYGILKENKQAFPSRISDGADAAEVSAGGYLLTARFLAEKELHMEKELNYTIEF